LKTQIAARVQRDELAHARNGTPHSGKNVVSVAERDAHGLGAFERVDETALELVRDAIGQRRNRDLTDGIARRSRLGSAVPKLLDRTAKRVWAARLEKHARRAELDERARGFRLVERPDDDEWHRFDERIAHELSDELARTLPIGVDDDDVRSHHARELASSAGIVGVLAFDPRIVVARSEHVGEERRPVHEDADRPDVRRRRLSRLGRPHRDGSTEHERRQEIEGASDFFERGDSTCRGRFAHGFLGFAQRFGDAREPEDPSRRTHCVHASDEADRAFGVGRRLFGRTEGGAQRIEASR
jgi:hypothetical protein